MVLCVKLCYDGVCYECTYIEVLGVTVRKSIEVRKISLGVGRRAFINL